MKIIHLTTLIIVAFSLVSVSIQYNISALIVYGVWISGLFVGMGLYEASKKL